MGACVWTCLVLSCFAVLVLPIWSAMLLNESPGFELPSVRKKNAGVACALAAVLYAAVGVLCTFIVFKRKGKPLKFSLGKGSDVTRQIEMKPLLGSNSDQSESAVIAVIEDTTTTMPSAEVPPSNRSASRTPMTVGKSPHFASPGSAYTTQSSPGRWANARAALRSERHKGRSPGSVG